MMSIDSVDAILIDSEAENKQDKTNIFELVGIDTMLVNKSQEKRNETRKINVGTVQYIVTRTQKKKKNT